MRLTPIPIQVILKREPSAQSRSASLASGATLPLPLEPRSVDLHLRAARASRPLHRHIPDNSATGTHASGS